MQEKIWVVTQGFRRRMIAALGREDIAMSALISELQHHRVDANTRGC